MYRILTVAFCIILFSINGQAQMGNTDSLQKVISGIPQPLQRFEVIRKYLEYINLENTDNIDSSLCIQLISIAQQLKSDSLMAISYNWIGSYFAFTKGDNFSALEYYYKAIPLAEKAKDKRRISSLYFDIATVYEQVKNYTAAFENNIKGGENLPDRSSPMYNFMLVQYQRIMCAYYLNIAKADSALYYARLTSATAARVGAYNFTFSAIFLTAAAYAMQKDVARADSAFNKAIPVLSLTHLYSLRSVFYTNYIPFLISTARLDRAKIFCRQLLILGNTYNSNIIRLQAASYMQQIFDELHQTDSAYYYSRLESRINADIFSDGNINRMQALSFHEKLRGLEAAAEQTAYRNKLKQYILATGLFLFLLIGVLLYRNNMQKRNTNKVLEKTLSDLKSTQSQLIQSEKMASLGELTAGIAHEIQNPLNFVNNFSEVNKDLLAELNEELDKGNYTDAKAIANDVMANEEKINHHGKRADAIVKGMLQHSRSSSGTKEPADINALCEEYLRLAYHGLRAKDKSFNAAFKTEFDERIGKINIVPQDMGRVILNLINNAFYAVDEKQKAERLLSNAESYQPTVTVSTKKLNGKIEISVTDNGNGIPDAIKEKIFQPFFTTKPTGQGTGLGLSLSYDIVKAHGGELRAETKQGEGSHFSILLPLIN